METSVIDWKERRVSVFYSNVNKIFLGTDGAASLRVGQMLPLRVEGSIPYSAPLTEFEPCGSETESLKFPDPDYQGPA